MEQKASIYRFCTTIKHKETKRTIKYIRRVKATSLEPNIYHLFCLKYEFHNPSAIALVRKVAYVFDEVIIELDTNKKIINIKNSKAIQKRWEKTKQDLLKNNSGPAVKTYLQTVNKTIYKEGSLFSFLESDKMYGLFLKSLWLIENKAILDKMEVIETADNQTIIEQKASVHKKYIYKNSLLKECYEIKDNKQYDILCLGHL